MAENVRAHLIVSGRVQGVNFRAETRRAAAGLGLTGWVKNRHDGTVEAVVEGPRPEAVELVSWCRHGPPVSRVDRVDVSWQDFMGEFDAFTVDY